MNVSARREAFVAAGAFIRRHFQGERLTAEEPLHSALDEVIAAAHVRNNWFIPRFTNTAVSRIGEMLTAEGIDALMAGRSAPTRRTVAIICAGNVPMVGFHDIMCTVLAGHRALIRLSSDDDVLLPFFLRLLVHYEPGLEPQIAFAAGKLTAFDAVIATGSDNTASHFHYYFGKYPHIIRKNRTSVAVLDGTETEAELHRLGEDIFLYFGLGCRNVSKLLVPRDYTFDAFFPAMMDYSFVTDNKKYGNNYDYHRALYLFGKHPFLDNNFMIVKEDAALHAPVSVVYYERFASASAVEEYLSAHTNELQCKVGRGYTGFGYSQRPVITDFADHVDTISFLVNL